ncbi:exo-alpha-sialidase [Draconibacterium sp.]|nr:exo-alpha-sialidase [Draconibacterium sp.]
MKTNYLIYFILVFHIVSCNNPEQNKDKNEGKEIVLKLEPSKGNPRNSEGDFIQLKDGRILFIYTKFTGGSGDHAQAHLVSRVSGDKGKTWSSEDVLVVPNEGYMNVMSVSLLRLNDGRIALFYLRKNSTSSCIPYLRISTDETATWSEPIRCIETDGYYVLNNDRVIQLKNDRLLLPVALHGSLENGITSKATLLCYYSDDHGQHWKKGQEVQNPDNITLQEPGVTELKKGRIMMYSRTDEGVQYFSYSKDQGESWTMIEPGNIISPLSPASIKRIPKTGDLILVWNQNILALQKDNKRTPFNLAVSKDDGKGWNKIKTIESDPDGWYCYTAIEFVDDFVLLGHCAGNRQLFNGLETTRITRLSLDWVYENATPEPFVKSDKNGVIELACKEEEAVIRYTLDGSNPDPSSKIYSSPLPISRTTQIKMQAYITGRPASSIVSKYAGSDILQKAILPEKNILSGLSFSYFEGEVARTSDIENIQEIKSGITQLINLDQANRDENFAFLFTGYIQIPHDGKYTFYLQSNDGSVLEMDASVLIGNDGPHGTYEKAVPVTLQKGFHSISVKYFQNGGGKVLKLFWESPDITKCEVPDSVLFHTEYNPL